MNPGKDMTAPGDGPLAIALVSEWYRPRVGGIELHVHDLATHLKAAGHKVTVITPTPGPAVDQGVAVVRLGGPRFFPGRFAFAPATFAALRQCLAALKPDIVHCHASVVSPVPYAAAVMGARAGRPVILTFHSALRHWGFLHLLQALARLPAIRHLPIAISAVSAIVADQVAPLAAPQPVVILPNGCDPSRWNRPPTRRDPQRVRLVAVMRLTPKKRPLALVAMMARVVARTNGRAAVQLEIVGEGPQHRAVAARIKRLGLQESILLAGRVSRAQVAKALARADVFVAPATMESFGLAALEARSAGLPVVARAGTGISQFVENGRQGFVAGSDGEMVKAIVRLVLDNRLRKKMADTSRREAPAFTWPRVIAAHLNVYGQVIRGRWSGGPSGGRGTGPG